MVLTPLRLLQVPLLSVLLAQLVTLVIALLTAQALSVMVLHKLLCAQKVNTVLQALKLPQLTVQRATSAQKALLLKFPAHQATLVTALAILILQK